MKLVVLGGNVLEYFLKEQEPYILRTPPVEAEGLNQVRKVDLLPEIKLVQSGGTEKKVHAELSGKEQPFETKFLIHEDLESVSLTEIISDDNETKIFEFWPAGSFDVLLNSDIDFDIFGMTLSGDFFVIISWEMMKRVHAKLMSLEADVLQ